MSDIKLSVVITSVILTVLFAFLYFQERDYENKKSEMRQKWQEKWQDFTVTNLCVISEKNEKAGTISWKCADGIIYTKHASILNGAK